MFYNDDCSVKIGIYESVINSSLLEVVVETAEGAQEFYTIRVEDLAEVLLNNKSKMETDFTAEEIASADQWKTYYNVCRYDEI